MTGEMGGVLTTVSPVVPDTVLFAPLARRCTRHTRVAAIAHAFLPASIAN